MGSLAQGAVHEGVHEAVPETVHEGSPPHQTAITIYNNNLALVQDIRQMRIVTGRQRLEFPGVSARSTNNTGSADKDPRLQ